MIGINGDKFFANQKIIVWISNYKPFFRHSVFPGHQLQLRFIVIHTELAVGLSNTFLTKSSDLVYSHAVSA